MKPYLTKKHNDSIIVFVLLYLKRTKRKLSSTHTHKLNTCTCTQKYHRSPHTPHEIPHEPKSQCSLAAKLIAYFDTTRSTQECRHRVHGARTAEKTTSR